MYNNRNLILTLVLVSKSLEITYQHIAHITVLTLHTTNEKFSIRKNIQKMLGLA